MRQVSNKKIIKELDSEELVEYVENIWKNTFNKNTGLMLLCSCTKDSPRTSDDFTSDFKFILKDVIEELKLCSVCYKQITGMNILTNMCDEFNKEFEKINNKIKTNDIKTA